MHICREVNLASSSSWMYIAYISFIDLFNVTPLLIFCFWQKGGEHYFVFTLTPLWWLTKRGRSILDIYACFGKGFMFMHIVFVLQIGEKEFDVFHACLCMFISLYLHTCLWAFIAYLFVSCYAWVMGELLWSFTLIHAYITPWVLSSKRGRLLAQRPSTLVLMMINSCSYVY